jgi:streptogramin lyase
MVELASRTVAADSHEEHNPEAMPAIAEFPFGVQPYGVACTPDGTVYYTDSGAGMIGRIGRDGSHESIPLSSLAERPFGIAAGTSGDLWITEWSNPSGDGKPGVQLVSRLDPTTGEYGCRSIVGYGTPRNIISGPDEQMWFTIGASLGAITGDGILRVFEPSWVSPWKGFESNGISAAPDGTIWIGVGGRVPGLASFDSRTEAWQLHRTKGYSPQCLAATPDGRIWFTSFGYKKVGWLQGDQITEVDFDGSPFGILAISASEIWVTDFSNNRLALLDPNSGTVDRYVNLNTSKTEPQLLIADTSGDLWVTLQKGSVAHIGLSGGTLASPRDSEEPSLIATDPMVLPRKLEHSLQETRVTMASDLPPDPSPITATFSPHPSFETPDDNLTLWRYIDLAKLISMLRHRSIFFARLDSQTDRFEGSLLSRTLDDDTETLLPLAIRGRPELRPHFDVMRSSLSNFRPRALMSCWHASDHESAAMWDLYAETNHGIAVRTTVGRLRRSIDSAEPPSASSGTLQYGDDRMAYFMGVVRYLDYEHDLLLPSTGLDYLTCKRRSYDYEHEVRLVVLSDTPVAGGQQIACSLNELVESIYVAPNAPPWFFDAVLGVLETFETGWEPRQSDLARDPLL